MAAPGLASPPASTALLGGLEVPSTLADALAFESAQSLQQLPAAPLRGISTPALQQGRSKCPSPPHTSLLGRNGVSRGWLCNLG